MGGRQISRHFICPSQISTPFPPKASAQSEKRLFRCALRRQEVEGEGGGGGHLGWCFAVHLLLPHPMILTVRHTQWHSLQNTQWYSQHQKRRTLNIEWKRFKDTSVLGVSFPDYKFPGETCLRRAHHFDFNYIGCTYDFSPFSNVRLFFWLRETDPRQAHHSGWQSHHMQRLSDITNTDIEISHEETHHQHWHHTQILTFVYSTDKFKYQRMKI